MAKHTITALVLLITQVVLLSQSFVLSSSPRKRLGSSLVLSTVAVENKPMPSNEKVFLVVGRCGLDRLLTVSSFPTADAKIRSTAYHEMGGGNAANTACAMALLCDASFLREENFRIKLLTKVGYDYLGKQLKDELDKSGVDTSLVVVGNEGTTTGFTSVIVSEAEHTRTCIHTPGTCGDLTPEDVASRNLDKLFANVVHVHSDSRCAGVSFMLAQEARKRNIRVSVDAEKDRHNKSFDRLLEISDIIFTDSRHLGRYLERRTAELEAEHQRWPLAEPMICTIGEDTSKLEKCANAIGPSHFFQRWYTANGPKELVITEGEKGALSVNFVSSSSKPSGSTPNDSHEVVASMHSSNADIVLVEQTLIDAMGEMTWHVANTYHVHHTGAITDARVVDTTGAGDAFIGAYILTQSLSRNLEDPIQFGLGFAAWVGGKKVSGPGARSALPKGCEVDDELGQSVEEIQSRLRDILRSFAAVP